MNWLHTINCAVAFVFIICYSYQFFYIIYGIIKKPKTYPITKQENKYAVLIPARNEEKVIGQLIESIKNQDYPAELVDVYVLADNCTDATALVAGNAGAIVYERFDKDKVGKGYALEFLFHKIQENYGLDAYDGYLFFDADNLLGTNYITEMNKCFSCGNKIVTSYRNSKNYGTNWITAGYSLWFLREARFLNGVRNNLNLSCAISGTGFLIHKDIIKKQGGWKHFLLAEDIEFTIDSVIKGEKIAYCDAARFYDEEPSTFSQSWIQRKRWSKGFIQVFKKYGLRLLGGIFRLNHFSCYDMMMTIAPVFITSLISVTVNFVAILYCLIADVSSLSFVISEIAMMLLSIYITLFMVGLVSGISEWKSIKTKASKKILSFFTFPLFMMTYIPISISALLSKVGWTEIKHNVSKTINEVEIS